MQRQLFGELLGQFADLSNHDVSEILDHQHRSRRRFGDIALSWGLCRPQHVWQAWWQQLSQPTEITHLADLGIDSQAIGLITRAVAEEFGVIPVRAFGNQIVLAASELSLLRAQSELPARLNMDVKFVLTDAAQIEEAIKAYYVLRRAS